MLNGSVPGTWAVVGGGVLAVLVVVLLVLWLRASARVLSAEN